jgi:3-dehydroquinate synthase
VGDALRAAKARRAILVTEPRAREAFGDGLAEALAADGWPVEWLMLPEGEEAKRFEVIGEAARELARRRVERGEPLVAIGGGALGDPAGFLAAAYLRGVPWIQVPTTLVAQVDSSIGGKTGVDLPEGKNLLGAFHHPSAIILDVAALRTLPERQLRAALGEIVKMAALGDEALFATLEADADAVAAGDRRAFEHAYERGVVAEIVERAGWAKVAVVSADEKEQGGATGRISLNLGHTVAHAIEAVDGYESLMHGEAVAYGLRAACRIGVAVGVTPAERAARVEALLDRLALGAAPLPYPVDDVLAATATDKKRSGGRQRWVLPTADGYLVRDDVDEAPVADAIRSVLAGREAAR